MSVFTFEQVIQAHSETRARIDEIASRHKEELAPLQDRLEKLTAWLLGQLNEQKLQNAKTAFGTAYKVERMVLKQADPDAFSAFVRNGHFELVNMSPATPAVKEFMEENQGQLPPGLSAEYAISVNVRRA